MDALGAQVCLAGTRGLLNPWWLSSSTQSPGQLGLLVVTLCPGSWNSTLPKGTSVFSLGPLSADFWSPSSVLEFATLPTSGSVT